jgi:cold shock CspA family protein
MRGTIRHWYPHNRYGIISQTPIGRVFLSTEAFVQSGMTVPMRGTLVEFSIDPAGRGSVRVRWMSSRLCPRVRGVRNAAAIYRYGRPNLRSPPHRSV